MPKLEKYDRRLGYSYALGLFPALKLLENKPESATRLLLRGDASDGEGVRHLRDVCARLGVREEIADRALERESGKENCFAAVVFDKYEAKLQNAPLHAVLHRVSDRGNFGTALRALLGFGIRDVAVVRPCVDIFDPHALRATMGAFFSMNVRAYDDFEDYRAEFPDRALYPFMLRGGKPLPEIARAHQTPCALVFGNEATGLPDAFADMGQSVFIPQSSEIDSFNLAVAVSIGAFAFTAAYKE